MVSKKKKVKNKVSKVCMVTALTFSSMLIPIEGKQNKIVYGASGNPYAINFDGMSNVFINDSESLRVDYLTMEAWVNPSSRTGETQIHNKEAAYEWRIDNYGNVDWAIMTPSRSWYWVHSNVNVPLGEWTHLALTYDGEKVRIYKNGILEYTSPYNYGAITKNNQALRIGARGGNYRSHSYFYGDIDESRIWNYARTQEEIARNMKRVLEGSEKGLVGYWRKDEGAGDTVTDLSGNNNHGTLEGGTWVPGRVNLSNRSSGITIDKSQPLEYGTGDLGDKMILSDIQINSYARLTNVNGNKIDISTITAGDSIAGSQFEVGQEILLYSTNSKDIEKAGWYEFFNIVEKDGNVLTLDKKVNLKKFGVTTTQVVTVPHYNNLTLIDGVTLKPMAYNGREGGILAFRVKEKLELQGNAKIDSSFLGYNPHQNSPNNGEWGDHDNGGGGGSNQFSGGYGGLDIDDSSAARNYPRNPGAVTSEFGIEEEKLFMGGAGGYGGVNGGYVPNPPYPLGTFGKGGGVIYAVAKEIILSDNAKISANGEHGGYYGYMGRSAQGGGAGGSIILKGQLIQGMEDFKLGATGGGGAASGSTADNNAGDGTNEGGGIGGTNTNYQLIGGASYGPNGGGGASQYGSTTNNGEPANAEKAGNGGDSATSAAGGGGGGYIAVYTGTDVTDHKLYPKPYIKTLAPFINILNNDVDGKVFSSTKAFNKIKFDGEISYYGKEDDVEVMYTIKEKGSETTNGYILDPLNDYKIKEFIATPVRPDKENYEDTYVVDNTLETNEYVIVVYGVKIRNGNIVAYGGEKTIDFQVENKPPIIKFYADYDYKLATPESQIVPKNAKLKLYFTAEDYSTFDYAGYRVRNGIKEDLKIKGAFTNDVESSFIGIDLSDREYEVGDVLIFKYRVITPSGKTEERKMNILIGDKIDTLSSLESVSQNY